jgi:outer membrane protein OmpA-like peptidoglycan-associated protein
MTSKKYSFLAGLACLVASTGFAQVSPTQPYTAVHPLYGTYTVTDPAYYNKKQLVQNNDFLIGKSDYPGKPKNMWEVGIKGGSFTIHGDMPADPLRSWGFGAHVRKALGHVMSLRLEYVYGVASGEDYRPMDYTGVQSTLSTQIWSENVDRANIYPNYKTKAQDLSLQALFNIHNIRFYKDQTNLTLYGIVGFGANTFSPRFEFGVQPTTQYDGNNKKDVLKNYRDAVKGSDYAYHLNNPTAGKWSKMFGGYVAASGTAGFGLAFRLNDRINLALEDRAIFVANDFVDGYLPPEWSNQGKDWYNYATLGLNFNLGNKAKRVEPLYWLNPLNYAYSELRRVSDVILTDSDGDGVIDQFDQEQTPKGCPVDTHGVSRDTDGDGVPDCRDKELVTPTYCQPVDADGVGKCPCPDDCKSTVVAPVSDCSTTLGALPSVSFASNSNTLSTDAQAALASVAARMRANPNCKVVVVGYCAATKKQQQLSWDHVNKVITYLVEKEGISSDRFIFSSGQEGGDCNAVDLRAAAPGEDGPNTVAPPHPNLRKN